MPKTNPNRKCFECDKPTKHSGFKLCPKCYYEENQIDLELGLKFDPRDMDFLPDSPTDEKKTFTINKK